MGARSSVSLRIAARMCVAALVLSSFTGLAVASENREVAVERIFAGGTPKTVADLRAMERHVQEITKRIVPPTVAVRVGQAHGSGVIISPDGYVLTAAHVAGRPGEAATLVLSNGRRVSGKTLGVYRTMDAGLIRIISRPGNDQDDWQHVKIGDSGSLAVGQWCMATGHPGGFEQGREPVLRVGRILSIDAESAIRTDCTLIGGDSGGPLFNVHGEVIGIHSRIGGPLHHNLHVPVNTYRQEWTRLTAGDEWGNLPGVRPYIGVVGVADANSAKITTVYPDTPAEQAGIRVGDIITRFAGTSVASFESLQTLVKNQAPGKSVRVEVRRGDRTLQLRLRIGDRRG